MCLFRKDGTGFCTEACETDADCPKEEACPDTSDTADAGNDSDAGGSEEAPCEPSGENFVCQDLGGEINRVCTPQDDS